MRSRAGLSALSLTPAVADGPFRFDAIESLPDMQALIRRDFPVGSPRDKVRVAFLDQGGATLKPHPTRAGVEKYLYDINLCSYYVWRWNISADYGPLGALRQMYVNGEPALPDGSPPPSPRKPLPNQKASIVKISRPRPEAYKGERNLVAVIIDHDSDLKTIDDQELVGAGPTRADPSNLGRLHVYHVDPWRSIFDADDTGGVVPYSGDCAAADSAANRAEHP